MCLLNNILIHFSIFRGSDAVFLFETSVEVNISPVSAHTCDILNRESCGGEEHFRIGYPAVVEVFNKCHTEMLFIGSLESRAAHSDFMGASLHIAVFKRFAVYFVADGGYHVVLRVMNVVVIAYQVFMELDENELHEAVGGHSPALILGIVLIYNGFHAIAEKADIHFHRSLKWDVQFEKILIFLLRFKIKMYPVILENMTFHTSVVLGSAFRIEKDGICGNVDIFSVNGKNRISFQQKKEIITASIGAVNVKICIMAVVIACVVDNHIASSLKNKQTAPRQSAERHYSFIFSGS